MPRPSGGSRQSNGVGKIYVKYNSIESAHKAMAALAGRKFADRTVVVTYFSEVSFGDREIPGSMLTYRKENFEVGAW